MRFLMVMVLLTTFSPLGAMAAERTAPVKAERRAQTRIEALKQARAARQRRTQINVEVSRFLQRLQKPTRPEVKSKTELRNALKPMLKTSKALPVPRAPQASGHSQGA